MLSFAKTFLTLCVLVGTIVLLAVFPISTEHYTPFLTTRNLSLIWLYQPALQCRLPELRHLDISDNKALTDNLGFTGSLSSLLSAEFRSLQCLLRTANCAKTIYLV